MRRPLIIANWKSNPATLRDAGRLAAGIEKRIASIRGVETVIAPPFPFLAAVARTLKTSALGAQDAFWGGAGPFTGAVSWQQLKSFGVSHIIIGHSERRRLMGETDEMIARKVTAVLAAGMHAVLCVGEAERVGDEIPDAVGVQLSRALASVRQRQLKKLIVAYEPVWAISTTPGARPDSPENAFRAGTYIRKIIAGKFGAAASRSARVIYGGSVRAGNIRPFIEAGAMEGALVGGASLDAAEFACIVKNTVR